MRLLWAHVSGFQVVHFTSGKAHALRARKRKRWSHRRSWWRCSPPLPPPPCGTLPRRACTAGQGPVSAGMWPMQGRAEETGWESRPARRQLTGESSQGVRQIWARQPGLGGTAAAACRGWGRGGTQWQYGGGTHSACATTLISCCRSARITRCGGRGSRF